MKKNFSIILFFVFFLVNSYGGSLESDILTPDKAFKPTAYLKNDKIVVDIKLGDKVYLYKDKLKFIITEPKQIDIKGDIKLPKPVKYHEFIVYFNELKSSIPLSLIRKKLGNDVKQIKLQVGFQGCTQLGLCYAPMKKSFTFSLPNIKKEISSSTSKPPVEDSLESSVLMPDQAFKPSATLKDDKIDINIKLGDKIYLYKDKLKFTILKPKRVEFKGDIKLPKPVKYHEFIVYFNELKSSIPLSLIRKKLGEDVKNVTLQLSFQGCSKLGLCYAPMKKSFTFDLNNVKKQIAVAKWNLQKPNDTKSAIKKNQTKKAYSNVSNISEEDSIAQTLKKSSLWVVLITFFGFGLLLSLTPCVFPMIPILSSIIVSQSKDNMNAKRGFFLSLVYVLAMSVAYTIAGVLAGLFGANIQILLQNPWVIGTFALIFVVLAFSMFGYYELQLPQSLQSKISKKSDSAQGKGVVGVAIMGFLSALIVGPCVAAPLAGALIYIGQSGDALLGGAALFVMSLGMGAPLLLIGIGAGKFMPKPGGWMENVSKVFGVIMLAVAVYLLSRVIPGMITMLLWAFLFLGSAVYLGALEPLKEGVKGYVKLAKVIGIILFVYGLILFVGAYMGNTNPLDPLENFSKQRVLAVSPGTQNVENRFTTVTNIKDLEKIVKNSNKPVMVDFYADWCVSCKELEVKTFNDSKVKYKLRDFTLIRADVTENSKENKELMKKYHVFGPPVIIFFDKNHNLLKSKKIVGFIDADSFLKHLKSL